MYRSLINLLCLFLLTFLFGCTQKVEVTNQRLVPNFLCGDEETPIVARWNYKGPNEGRVRIFTSDNTLLCNVRPTAELCIFNQTIDTSDIPLTVKAIHDGEEVFSGTASFVLLSGPRDTNLFQHTELLIDENSRTINVDVPVYRTCDSARSQEPGYRDPTCVETTQGIDCFCRDEGRVVDIVQETHLISVNEPSVFIWDLSLWFSPSIQTRLFRYPAGNEGAELIFSGPGIAEQRVAPGGPDILGNNQNPSGIWLGKLPSGQTVAIGPDNKEIFDKLIQLNIACEP